MCELSVVTPEPMSKGLLWMPVLGGSLLIAGISLEIASLLSLGRSFGIVANNRGIKTGGAYHYVRHPLYFSYCISNMGYTLANYSFANLLVCLCSLAAIVLSIIEEERVLIDDPAFAKYKEEVAWRILPGVFNTALRGPKNDKTRRRLCCRRLIG